MTRIDYRQTYPPAYLAMLSLEDAVDQGELEPRLRHLVDLRTSQLNGCETCVRIHLDGARAAGVSECVLSQVAAWREAVAFSDRERAALAWCEALTELPCNGVPDDVYQELEAQFDAADVVKLTLAIVTVNAWNRLNVAFGIRPTPSPD